MDREPLLAHGEDGLATGGSINQPQNKGADNANPYAQAGVDLLVMPEAAQHGGRGTNNENGDNPLMVVRDCFCVAGDMFGAAAAGGDGHPGPHGIKGTPATQARTPAVASANQ